MRPEILDKRLSGAIISPMAVFYGHLQQPGDRDRLPATVYVGERTIRLQTGQTQIGEWKLGQVGVEELDSRTVVFTADGEDLYLFLDEHQRFLDVTAPYQLSKGAKRRAGSHPAFRKDEGPSLGEEVKREVGREVESLAGEARELREMVKPGPVLWISLAVLFVLIVFLPGLAVGLSLGIGMIALGVGAAGYAEDSIARRIPEPLSPARLVVVGGALIVLGILVSIIR